MSTLTIKWTPELAKELLRSCEGAEACAVDTITGCELWFFMGIPNEGKGGWIRGLSVTNVFQDDYIQVTLPEGVSWRDTLITRDMLEHDDLVTDPPFSPTKALQENES